MHLDSFFEVCQIQVNTLAYDAMMHEAESYQTFM